MLIMNVAWNGTARVVGALAVGVLLTAASSSAKAQSCPTCPGKPSIPEDPVCSIFPDPDDPYNLCPDGFRPCQVDCYLFDCCWECIKGDCPTIFCPEPPPTAGECPNGTIDWCPPNCVGPGCALFTVEGPHCPSDDPVQVGSLISFSACNFDCSLPENLNWSICQGDGKIVSSTNQCAIVQATGPGLLVVIATTSDDCFFVQVEAQVTVQSTCAGDIDDDNDVDVDDYLAVINSWGTCSPCASDLNCTGTVDVDDLLVVINQYGGCL